MTVFEITITILAVLGILMVGLLIKLVNTVGHILLNIIGDVGVKNAEMISATNGHLANIQQQLNNIEDNILDDFKQLIDTVDKIEGYLDPSFEWGKLTQEQQNEFLYRLTHPVVESPFKPPFNPTCETTNND